MSKYNSSNTNTPLYDQIKIKGINSFSVPCTSEASESSTGDSNQNNIYINEEGISKKKINKKKEKKIKKEKTLNKKRKRSGSIFNNKDNIINNIFKEFKSSTSLIKSFPQFNIIEKNIKNGLYSNLPDFITEIRNTFSSIFLSCSKNFDDYKYNQILSLSEIFEKIYKKYDCDSMAEKARYLFDVMTKLKKEIHKHEFTKNEKNKSEKKEKSCRESNFSKNERVAKQYKDNISNKINKLNLEQKKGVLKIISQNLIDKNENNSIVEFNINKIPYGQLKQLDRYINECINDNIFEKIRKNCGIDSYNTIEEHKENDMIEEQENSSSFFSDDEYDEDDLE